MAKVNSNRFGLYTTIQKNLKLTRINFQSRLRWPLCVKKLNAIGKKYSLNIREID